MVEIQLFFGLIFMIGGAGLVIGGIALAVAGIMGLLKGQHDPYDYDYPTTDDDGNRTGLGVTYP